jgi:hypothetical protein
VIESGLLAGLSAAGGAGRPISAPGSEPGQDQHRSDFAAHARLVRGRLSSGRTSSNFILPVFETAKPAVKRN